MLVGKTSECVAKGHPDKVSDIISDSLLDACMEINPHVRTGIECLCSPNRVTLAGEIGGVSLDQLDVETIVRSAVREIGYVKEEYGFNADTLVIDNHLNVQSADIAQGVVGEGETRIKGAGDIGIMFGYACNENSSMIQTQFLISKELMDIHNHVMNWNQYGIRPDAKCQFTITPDNHTTLVFCVSHDEDGAVKMYVNDCICELINRHSWMEKYFEQGMHNLLINPTGKFVICGPMGDSGLTGRKIVVDQYGGASPVGGGAFSGKDCSKVDRSAAYMARFLARKIVNETASNATDEVIVGLSYAIGMEQPTSLEIRSNYLSDKQAAEISEKLRAEIDMSPQGICDLFNLKKIKYAPTAENGHFGITKFAESRLSSFPWETME